MIAAMAAKTAHSVVGVGARPQQQVRSAMPRPGSSSAVRCDSPGPDRPLLQAVAPPPPPPAALPPRLDRRSLLALPAVTLVAVRSFMCGMR